MWVGAGIRVGGRVAVAGWACRAGALQLGSPVLRLRRPALLCKTSRGWVAAWEFNTFPQDEYGKTVLPSLHPASSALYNTIRRKKKAMTLLESRIL